MIKSANKLRATGRRRTQGRLDVRLQAKLVTLLSTHTVILDDISREGAMVSLEAAPAQGSNVLLRWDSYEACGTVSWVSPGRCGLLFSGGISEATLRATLALQETSALPEDSDLSREAAREWASGNAGFGFD